jgi:hypothetical protein
MLLIDYLFYVFYSATKRIPKNGRYKPRRFISRGRRMDTIWYFNAFTSFLLVWVFGILFVIIDEKLLHLSTTGFMIWGWLMMASVIILLVIYVPRRYTLDYIGTLQNKFPKISTGMAMLIKYLSLAIMPLIIWATLKNI